MLKIYKKYLKSGLLIIAYSVLGLALLDCGGASSEDQSQKNQINQHQIGTESAPRAQTKKPPKNTHKQPQNNLTLIEQLEAAPKSEYAQILREALDKTSDAKKLLAETDDQGSTVGHYLASASPIDIKLLKKICDLAPANCTVLNKSGEGSFDIAAKHDENLSKELLDIYQSHTGPDLKFKDGDTFLQKVIKAKNAPDCNKTIEELLVKNSGIYFKFSEAISDLFLDNNLTNIDAELYEALVKHLGSDGFYNTIVRDLGKNIVKKVSKKSEVAKLIARPDIKDANSFQQNRYRRNRPLYCSILQSTRFYWRCL